MVKIRPNGDIGVAVNGSRWIFNPKCLTPAPGDIPIEERTGNVCHALAFTLFTAKEKSS